MELKEALQRAQQPTNLQVFVPNTLEKQQDRGEISVYRAGAISPQILGSGIKSISQAFPKLPVSWYTVLKEMLKDEQFDDARFSDAVKSLVKNCIYPEPTIANIVSFDRMVKVFTLSDLQAKHKDAYHFGNTYDPIAREYSKIDFHGQERYARKEDVERYNLKLFPTPKKPKPQPQVFQIETGEPEETLQAGDLTSALKNPAPRKTFTAEEKAQRLREFNKKHSIS